MLLSINLTLPLTLLLSSLVGAAPNYDVLGGANFPDPSIINVDGVSYAFGTPDGAGHNIPMTSNPDFSDASGWSEIIDAFPPEGVPAFGDGGWAIAGTNWAPDVNRLVSAILSDEKKV